MDFEHKKIKGLAVWKVRGPRRGAPRRDAKSLIMALPPLSLVFLPEPFLSMLVRGSEQRSLGSCVHQHAQ